MHSQGNSAELLRGSSQSLEADWEGSLLEGEPLSQLSILIVIKQLNALQDLQIGQRVCMVHYTQLLDNTTVSLNQVVFHSAA